MPLNNIIILESSPDYSDSAYALFEYFLSKGVNKKYKIVWYLNKNFTDYPKYQNVEYVYRHSDDREKTPLRSLVQIQDSVILPEVHSEEHHLAF